MNTNKSTKILKILIIVFVLIIIVAAGLFVFLVTDLFKSDKTLFAKYASGLLGKDESFIGNDVINYYKKIIETPFKNESSLDFNTEQTGQDLVNQLSITLNGQVDVKSKSIEEGVSVNYSPEVTLPINVRYKDGLFGYQTEYVGSKYIVNDKTQSVTTGTSENNESESTITQEDIQNLIKKYGEIALNQLSDDKFSKENSGDSTIYKLTVTETDVNNMVNAVYETLSQDQETIQKFNLDIDKINDYIEKNQNNTQSEDESNIEIALYKNNGNITKVEVKKDEMTLSLEKISQNGSLQYKLIFSNENANIELDLSYSGLSTLQNVEENYVLSLNTINNDSSVNLMTYNLSNKVDFVDSVNIESFDDNNAIIYSKYDPTQIDSFDQAVTERMEQVNQMQMEQLGIDASNNPVTKSIVEPILSLALTLQASNTINNVSLQTQVADVNTFNQKFEIYEGTNIQGTTVRGLLTTIANNNGIQSGDTTTQQNTNTSLLGGASYKIEEINFNGEEYEVNGQNIAALKEEVVAENYYRVEFEKDSNTGLIYRAVINPK